MVKVVLENVGKTFVGSKKAKETVAVKGFTAEFPSNKVVGILGPSGCGKTTTLRAIAGLDPPSEGKIYFGDRDVTYLPPIERDAALLFQFAVVYNNMTVFDNLAFPLMVKNVEKGEIKKRVNETAGFLGLTDILKKKARKLPAGVNQKIALGRAIIRRPQVLLLDEPLSSLDPESRLYLRRELKNVIRSMDTTAVYVTHDQSEAMTLCDKIAVMSEGKVHQYDTPENIYMNPATTFVAWFIGEPGMNLMDSSLEESKDKYLLKIDGVDDMSFDVSKWSDILKNSEKIVLGIRPEYVTVSKVPQKNSMMCKCLISESFGSFAILDILTNCSSNNIFKVKVTISDDLPKVDETVYLSFPVENIRLFDKKSGELKVVMTA
jgi:multiple sugar transport system ATP-binding protein